MADGLTIFVRVDSAWAHNPFFARWEGYVELPDLERPANPDDVNEALFRFFNRVDDADAERLERLGYKLPSLSVGDRVLWAATGSVTAYHCEVEAVGFVDLPNSPVDLPCMDCGAAVARADHGTKCPNCYVREQLGV